MTPFNSNDIEWNELCMNWSDNVIEGFKKYGIYDSLLALCEQEQNSIQPPEQTINFEELYDTFKS